jgi:hypothetical protein
LYATITKAKNDNRENPKLYDFYETFESVVQYFRQTPTSRINIPAYREFLESLVHEDQENGWASPALRERAEEVILELKHVEQSIEKRLCPNLGQSLSSDFKGSNVLARYIRYEGHIEHSLYRALMELQKIQLIRARFWQSTEYNHTDPEDENMPPKPLTSVC